MKEEKGHFLKKAESTAKKYNESDGSPFQEGSANFTIISFRKNKEI